MLSDATVKGTDGPANCLKQATSTEAEQPVFRVATEEHWMEYLMQSASRKVPPTSLLLPGKWGHLYNLAVWH